MAAIPAKTTLVGGALNESPPIWHGGGLQPTWFDVLGPVAQPRQINPSSTNPVTIDDADFSRASGGTTVNDYRWGYVRPPFSANTDTISASTGNTGIATGAMDVDAGQYTYVSDGTTNITLSSSARSASLPIDFDTTAATDVDTFTGFVAGSLRKHITDTVNGLLAGKTASEALPVWSVKNHSLQIYTRNSACWLAGINLSCISPYNSATQERSGGILISPSYVAHCQHVTMGVGAVMNFVSNSGVVFQRTVAAETLVAPSKNTDLIVVRLSSALPIGASDFTPAKVLPSDYATYLPGLTQASTPSYGAQRVFPVAWLDQQDRAQVWDAEYIIVANGGSGDVSIVHERQSRSELRSGFYVEGIAGDSGNPSMAIINGEVVALETHTSAGTGPHIGYYATEINAILAAQGESLSEVDLAGFNAY